mmetsp:Transcript_124992/g.399569  ORF Transcript_124992/g.399569 Transcript_124992/m.399569 type:complete len:721 (-) Transcript_124992:35-2197(-)
MTPPSTSECAIEPPTVNEEGGDVRSGTTSQTSSPRPIRRPSTMSTESKRRSPSKVNTSQSITAEDMGFRSQGPPPSESCPSCGQSELEDTDGQSGTEHEHADVDRSPSLTHFQRPDMPFPEFDSLGPSSRSPSPRSRRMSTPTFSPSERQKNTEKSGKRYSKKVVPAASQGTQTRRPKTCCQKIKSAMRKIVNFLLQRYRRAYITYLVIVILVGSTTMWVMDLDNLDGLKYLDAVFLAVSAITMTGLSTVDLSSQSIASQVVVWVIMLVGSPMMMSLFPVAVRLFIMRSESVSKGMAFFGLNTSQEDDSMALRVILVTVSLYWLLSQALAWVLFMIIFEEEDHYGLKAWNALFLSTSAWHNAGLVTLPNGSLPFKGDSNAASVLIVIMFEILCGNTCFPIMLRFLVWAQRKVAHLQSDKRRERVLDLLLKYPRTCYSHLFPDYATKWLGIAAVGLIGFQILVFGTTSAHNEDLMQGTTTSERVLAVVFQCISSRTAGFSVLNLDLLPCAPALVFMVCMWISTSPVTVIVKSTVREVHTKGGEALYGEPTDTRHEKDAGALRAQFSKFMSDNIYLLAVLLLIVLAVEDHNPQNPGDSGKRLMSIMFEFASAYGTVGLSMSGAAWSACMYWSRYSQAALMMVMFLGRIRGLPASIDPTVNIKGLALRGRNSELSGRGPTTKCRRRSASDPCISVAYKPAGLDFVPSAGPFLELPVRKSIVFA